MYKVCQSAPLMYGMIGTPTHLKDVESIEAGLSYLELIAAQRKYDVFHFDLDEEHDAADVFAAKSGTHESSIFTIERI